LGAKYTCVTRLLRRGYGLIFRDLQTKAPSRCRLAAPFFATHVAILILTLFLSLTAAAQQPVQVLWPLNTDSEAVYTSGIATASFSYGPALRNFTYDSLNGATASGWNGKNLDPKAYFEYTIVPERDASITFNRLKFEVSLSSVNMRTALYYSRDGFSKESLPLGNSVFVGKKSSRDLIVETSITVTYPQTLSIRVYGWSAPNAAVSFFTRDVELTGATRGPLALPLPFAVSGGGGYCAGGTGVSINLSGSEVGVTYSLLLAGNPTGSTLPGTGSPISFTNVTAAGIYTIRGTNTDGSTMMTGSASVTILPIPVATATPPGKTICSGSSTNISLTSTVGGTTFAWTVVASGVSGASNGSGSNINQVLTTTGPTQGTATYTVTPTASGCAGTPITVIITVNPIPNVTINPASQNICSGSATSLALTSNVAGATFSWTQVSSGATGASNGSGSLIAQTLNATGASPGTVTYTVTPSAATCTGSPVNAIVTVRPTPVITATPGSQNACPDQDITSPIVLGSNIAGTTYSWTRTIVPELTGLESGTGTPIAGTIFSSDPGTLYSTTFTIIGTAPNGCTATTTATVNVGDLDSPVINCPVTGTVNVTTNSGCTYLHAGNTWNATYTETCKVMSFGYTLTGATTGTGITLAGVAFNIGTTNVTWSITDIGGHPPVTCSYTVIVADDDKPVITCPGAQVAGTNVGCTYSHSGTGWDATATDNCSGSITLTYVLSGATTGSGNTTLNGVIFNRGVTTVTWTATDPAGNFSTCFYTVTVNDDDPPVIVCPGNQIVNTNTNCTYVHNGTSWNATATDNCSVTSFNYTLSGATTGTGNNLNGRAFNRGITTVTWTASDGPNTVSCSFTVTVNDVSLPTITCPASVTASANGTTCSTKLTLTNPITSDNCGIFSLTWTMTGATVASSPATGINYIPANYEFNVGITTITYTVTDQSSNTASCSFTVTVTDNRPPVITCPTVAASYNNIAGQCYATLSFTATATDNCGVMIIKYFIGATEISFPYNFPVGTTTVTAIAYDFNNNSNPCNFTVTVIDAENPTITCLPAQTRNVNTTGCLYTVQGSEFDPPAYSDNCPGYFITNTKTNTSTLANATFSLGTHTVTWTIQDATGKKTSCILTINILDNQVPTFTNCPSNITVYTGPGRTTCDQTATWTPPTASDNCSGAVTVTSNYAPGSLFPVGITTVIYTATDPTGNSATCTFTVTVIDNTAPDFTVPSDVTIYTDASCNYNAGISVTGDVTDERDNCPITNQATFSDVTTASPPCVGNFVITRTWRLEDAAIPPNVTTKVQTITVRDNTPPTFTYLPDNISVNCSQGIDPIVTGQATAVDNCNNPVTVTKSDTPSPDPFCPQGGTITRTWTATDCSGNTRTGIQLITVYDNTAPTGYATAITVACPADIPDPNTAVVVATDNCTPSNQLTIVFDYEIAQFPPNSSGYCPTYVDRYYNVTDLCGNTSVIVHRVNVTSTCNCAQCANVQVIPVDLLGQPTGTITIPNVERNGLCCDAERPARCVAFSIRLDPGAVGLEIRVDGATPSSQDWRQDCAPITITNGIVCMPGGTYYLFTYCKEGANKNTFTFRSLAGVVVVDDANARVGCSTQLNVTNTTSTNTVWNSIAPGNPGQYNSYLSCTNCNNPTFTPGPGAPPVITYQVCGDLAASPCYGQNGYGCDEVDVTVFDPITVTITPDPNAYCQSAIPTFTANVTGAGGSPTIRWYNGPDGTGTMVATGPTYKPTVPGAYSVVVTDNRVPAIPCSTYTYNFTVAPDDHPPVVTAPPNLILQCNDPNNAQLIQNWLASATAIDDNTPNPVITNNYTGITQGCNVTVVVTWTATDLCNNQGTASASIIINDTQIPTWTTTATEINRTVECSDAAGLASAQALTPAATDLCDPTLTITETSGLFVPDPICPQRGTYTNTFIARDDCNNESPVFTQVITITDNTSPTWTTLPGALNRTVECNDAAALAAAQADRPVATDNCDLSVNVVKTNGSFIPSGCANEGTYTNTFTAYDDCGNASSVYTQVITVEDNAGPVITTQASNLTVECDGSGNITQLNNWLNNHGGAAATDACSTTVTWSHNYTGISDLCGETGAATVVFTATDVCGNTSSTQATFLILDTQGPSITCPLDVTAYLDPGTCQMTGIVLGNAIASDMCSEPVTITNNAPLSYPPGVTQVTWTAIDACNNVTTCIQLVTVIDEQPPTVDCPDGVTVDAEPGLCEAYVDVPSPIVTDPCPYTITNSKTGTDNASSVFPVGTTIVTWTITDFFNNITTCLQEITVTDNQAPTITCPDDVFMTAPAPACTLVVTQIDPPVLTDNCPISQLVLSWEKTGATTGTGTGSVNGTLFNVGVTTVTYTVTDQGGNTDFCSFNVTVNDDVPPTVISCPGNISTNVEPGQCDKFVNVPLPTVIDPCGEIVTIENDFNNTANASDIYPVGTTLVTWTFTDNSGNISTCSHTVTVIDNIFPTITCPGNVTVTATPPDCFVPQIIVGNPVITENCPAYLLTWTKTGATTANGTGLVNNTPFNVGVTTVTYIVTDASNNVATCTFTVTVEDDLPPTFVQCPPGIIVGNDPGLCSAAITVPVPQVTDPCGEIVSVINDYNNTNNASDTYPVGITEVTWTITDASGNTTSCIQIIEVRDTERPVIDCPDDVTAIATPPDCIVPDYDLEAPVYTDNCGILGISWVMTGAATDAGNGELLIYDFPVGITTVTYTVTDIHNNTQSCFFTVTINDQVPPTVITCPPSQTVSAAPGVCSASVTIPPPVVDDPCNEIVSISHNSSVGTPTDPSGTYNVGVHVITWTLTDRSGNTSTCQQTITVTDNQLPTIDCPDDILAEALPPDCEVPNITLGTPDFADNCPNPQLSWSMTGPGGASSGSGYVTQTTFPVGTTVITYRVTDASGNFIECSFNVVVRDDVPPTIISCPPDETAIAEPGVCDAYVSVDLPEVDDPCGEIVSISNNSIYGTSDIDASGRYPVGVTVITWTFTDESGNTRQCTTRVTVTDNQAPVFTLCPDDVIAEAIPPNCFVPEINVPDPVYTDNCLNPILSYELTGATEATGTGTIGDIDFNVGVTVVTYTATDASGNHTECVFTVTVRDDIPPVVTACPPNQTVNANHDNCSADVVVPEPLAYDPCGEPVTYSHNSPHGISSTDASGNYPVGTYNITWTFVDASGNTTTCLQTIIVLDQIPPDLTCPAPITRNADLNQLYASNVVVPAPTYWDACGVEHLYYVVTGATVFPPSSTTGINTFPSPNTFNVGVTTITYTAIDFNGNISTCSFTVTVLSKPDIACPTAITANTDPGLCTATLIPGYPVLIEGAEPIDWTYTITNQAGDVIGSGGPCATATLSSCLGSFTFPVGVNTITWTATNISGSDQCTQTVTVIDNQPPTIIPPVAPTFCVVDIFSAVYDGQPEPDADIIPESPFLPPFIASWRRPDWYILNGTNELDITATDNCCSNFSILWVIDFSGSDPLQPNISGTGQPSAYGPIILWGTPLNVELTHTITYTITDCNGNTLQPISIDIIIKPRPDVIKQ